MKPRPTRRRKLISLAVSFLLFFATITPAAVLAATNHLFDPCNVTNTSDTSPSTNPADSGVCKQSQSQGTENPVSGPKGIIKTATNILAIVAGVGALVIIIISGFTFATAGGTAPGQRAGDSPNRAANARGRLINALIGLVVVALAWTIVTFTVDKIIK